MAAGLAVLTACGNAPEHVSGAAEPAGGVVAASSAPAATPSVSPSATAASAAATPSRTKSTPTNEPVAGQHTFGPDRFGALKIGMTVAQAEKTGRLGTYRDGPDHNGCGSAPLKGATDDAADAVIFNGKQGLVFIPGYGKVRTPEGIGIGSTIAQVKAAYADFEPIAMYKTDANGTETYDDGRAWADRSDKDGIHYRLMFAKGKVTQLGLEDDEHGCYE
ncbi:hypothetical protein [Actinoplanes ianthinogenes]|nr:hypothetical protein [Actinoplanes ianthinogenes]